jgi:hypothetical protein
MAVITSPDVLIDTSPLAQFGPDSPLIGYRNEIVPGGVVATSSAAGFPASNLANPSTYRHWRSASVTAGQMLTFTGLSPDDVNFLGIAAHNFGSAAIPIRLEGFDAGTATWIDLLPETTPPNDAPVIFRFPVQNITGLRVIFGEDVVTPPVLNAAPRAAVAYAGLLVRLERKLWIDHTPISYGRIARIANGRSESGNFLGRIVLNERFESTANIQFITPTHYRSEIDPFIAASKEVPFFFAWRPASYPNETGYAWMMNDPKVTHAAPHGLMQIELQMQGLA